MSKNYEKTSPSWKDVWVVVALGSPKSLPPLLHSCTFCMLDVCLIQNEISFSTHKQMILVRWAARVPSLRNDHREWKRVLLACLHHYFMQKFDSKRWVPITSDMIDVGTFFWCCRKLFIKNITRSTYKFEINLYSFFPYHYYCCQGRGFLHWGGASRWQGCVRHQVWS